MRVRHAASVLAGYRIIATIFLRPWSVEERTEEYGARLQFRFDGSLLKPVDMSCANQIFYCTNRSRLHVYIYSIRIECLRGQNLPDHFYIC